MTTYDLPVPPPPSPSSPRYCMLLSQEEKAMSLALFDALDFPRRPRIKRMHVSDAGHGCIEFTCRHCGFCTGWIRDEWTITANRRGLPCPKCNGRRHAPGKDTP